MTSKEVRERVKKIETCSGDPEMAHILEDALFEDLLQAIASQNCRYPLGCAIEALKVRKLKFARGYA